MFLWIAYQGCILRYFTDGIIQYQNTWSDAAKNFYVSTRHWDIYSSSAEVLMWLGAPKLDGGLAIETIHKLGRFFRRVDAKDPAATEELGRYRIMNNYNLWLAGRILGNFYCVSGSSASGLFRK